MFNFNKYIYLFHHPKILWAEYIFPSTLLVSPLVKILLEPIKSKEVSSRIELGLHEALVNAVQHGNNNDSSKILRIRRIITGKWYIWQIQDEGKGIKDSSRVYELPSNLESTGGRGLFLIHECFDDVRWSKKGNRLQIACKRFS